MFQVLSGSKLELLILKYNQGPKTKLCAVVLILVGSIRAFPIYTEKVHYKLVVCLFYILSVKVPDHYKFSFRSIYIRNSTTTVLVRYSSVQAVEEKVTRIYADKNLFQKIKAKYPETAKMDNTAIVHWSLVRHLEE